MGRWNWIPIALGLLAAPSAALAHPGTHAPEHVPAKVEAALGGGVAVTDSGLYRLETEDGERLTTHGPDFREEIADPKANHGSGLGPGDPERAPVCADPGTGRYQEILYGYWDPAGGDPGVNRLHTVRDAIRAAVRRMNAVLNTESLASGGPSADYVVRCDSGEIRVSAFPVTTSSGTDRATFSEVVDSAAAAGHANQLADYTIFYDGDGPAGTCGTGTYFDDHSLSVNNPNNNPGGATQGGYGVNYDGCWYGSVPMHENGHNQGAVQAAAPYSTGTGAHCYDENDVMCYSPDGGNQHQGGTINRCTDYLHFDCQWDTYFDAAPEPGEWLATHWNMGSDLNRYIAFGGAGNSSPAVSFAVSCSGLACSFTGSGTDVDGSVASWSWVFGDGATSSAQSPSHTFAAPGTYDVELTVTDDDGDSTSLAKQVKLAVPPPNDPFAGPEALSGTGATTTGTNVGATKQAGEPDHATEAGGDGGASVWYRWTAPAAGSVTVGTCGSDFDTLLAVYRSSDDITALPRIASNDDSTGSGCGGTNRSEVAFSAAAGTTYRIAVDGFDPQGTAVNDPATGDIALSLALAPSPVSPPIPPGGTGPGEASEPTTVPVRFPTKVIHRGAPVEEITGPRGSVHLYRLSIPRRVRNLRVVLDGPACVPTAAGCEPDLDLYLGDSADPAVARVTCVPREPGADEGCRVKRPDRGIWFASVENVVAAADTEFTLRATFRKRGRKAR